MVLWRLRHQVLMLGRTAPIDWPRLIQRRLGLHMAPLTAQELLRASKSRPQRPYDFLSRYEAILTREIGWHALDFEGSNVLELGCGPDFGWAPLAIFHGARRYACVDPELDSGVAILNDTEFAEIYLRAVHNDLTAIFGHKLTFETFVSELRKRVEIYPAPLLDTAVHGPFDVELSNSCLEHVWPLDHTVKRLRDILAPGGRFLHLVDFGNHRDRKDPFRDLYVNEPGHYFRRYGQGINLLRGSEITCIFSDAGFETQLVTYYRAGLPTDMHERWSRYDRDDLSLKAGLLVGRASPD